MTQKDYELIAGLKPFALNKCRVAEDAEDLLQDVFIKILNNIEKFESMPECEKRRYVYTAISNMYVDLIRSKARGRRGGFSTEINAEVFEPVTNPDAFAIMELKEVKANIKGKGAKTLMMYAEGYSVKELTNIFKVKQNTILAWNFRARNQLKKAA